MRATLCAALILAAGSVIAEDARFHDESCAIAFSYPRTWKAQRVAPARVFTHGIDAKLITCTIGLNPPGWAKKRKENELVAEFAVSLVVARIPFLVAADKAGFVRMDAARADGPDYERVTTRWGIYVRQAIDEAQEFRTACCQAVRGDSWSHAWDSNDEVYSVTSDVSVLNNQRGRSVIVLADEGESFDAVVSRIAETLELP